MPFALSSENSISSCVSTLSNSGLLLETITFSSSERPLYPPLANPLTGRGFVLVLCLRMASKARIWFMETGSCNCHAGVTYSSRCTGPATSSIPPLPVNPPLYQPVESDTTRCPVCGVVLSLRPAFAVDVLGFLIRPFKAPKATLISAISAAAFASPKNPNLDTLRIVVSAIAIVTTWRRVSNVNNRMFPIASAKLVSESTKDSPRIWPA